MHKVVFAAALAVGLITAPMSQFVSSAAAQQASAEKYAKMKQEPSAGQLAARERQKKCGAEWKEAKASNKIEKGTTWPKFWKFATSVSSPPPTDIASTRARRNVRIKKLRASARLESRRRPQGHPNRGVPGNRIAPVTP